MIAVSISFVLLLSGLVAMGVTAGKQWAYGSSKLIADGDASMAIQKLANEIRDGKRIDTAASTSSTLVVVFPLKNATTGDYDRFTDGTTYKYFLSGGNLVRQQGTNPTTVIARAVNTVSFTYSGNNQVQITLRTQKQMGTRTGVTTYVTQVSLRNEPTS
ncbi:MAG TPA: hypothetical protein VFU47_05980 [Armatimonadota bacterium]|nr:hypothetical protein [Armatimonadota bacterium]